MNKALLIVAVVFAGVCASASKPAEARHWTRHTSPLVVSGGYPLAYPYSFGSFGVPYASPYVANPFATSFVDPFFSGSGYSPYAASPYFTPFSSPIIYDIDIIRGGGHQGFPRHHRW